MAGAADTTRLVRELQELVECPVCLEPVVDPRALPCQHSFCLRCLQGVVQGGGTLLRCPCCNLHVTLPDGPTALPRDFRANKWLQVLANCRQAAPSPHTVPHR